MGESERLPTKKKPRDIYSRFAQSLPAQTGRASYADQQIIILDEDETSDSESDDISTSKPLFIPPWRRDTTSSENCDPQNKLQTVFLDNGHNNEPSKVLEADDRKSKGRVDKMCTLVEQDSNLFGSEPLATNHSLLNGTATDHFTGIQPLFSGALRKNSTTSLQPVSTAGLQPVSTAGLQPVSTAGLQPVSTAGLQPVSTAGLQPVSTAGLQPVSTAGLQPVSTAGLQSVSAAGLQSVSTAGLQSVSTAGLQPVSTAGLQSVSTAGLQPVSTAGLHTKSTEDFHLPRHGARLTKSCLSLRTPGHNTDDHKENEVPQPSNGVSTRPGYKKSIGFSALPRETPKTSRQPGLSVRGPGARNNHSDSGCCDLHTSTIKHTRNVAVQTTSFKLTRGETTTDKEATESQKASARSMLMPKTITVNKKSYIVLNLLGKGGSSKVEQVFDMDSCQRLALKTVDFFNQPPQNVAAFREEIEMLKKLQFSDRVIKLVDFDYGVEKLHILLECGDTDLAVYLKRRLEEGRLHRMQRCIFWHEMLQAVQVLHDQGIVHSDIKPANFMLVAGEIKLIDFGIAKQLDADATSMVLESCVGTLNYMSPEVLSGLGNKGNCKAGRKADVWSLGCILYYMTYGVTPFQSIKTFISKVAAITDPSHSIGMEDVGEPHLSHTIQLCLERDYKKRASIEELLRHPYVS